MMLQYPGKQNHERDEDSSCRGGEDGRSRTTFDMIHILHHYFMQIYMVDAWLRQYSNRRMSNEVVHIYHLQMTKFCPEWDMMPKLLHMKKTKKKCHIYYHHLYILYLLS